MSQKSKFFRVLVEGATVDGRTVERNWIEEMAASYNPTTYGARINLEHFKGILPDGPFKAYGDVTAVKAEEVEIDGKKKLALFAQIDPTPDMVAMNKARQKIYTSCEVNPKFADTGKAYLIGLAVTDSPASLGTEMLAFSAQAGDKSPLAARKQSPGNHFSEATETVIEFEAEAEGPTLLSKVKDMLGLSAKRTEATMEDVRQATELLAENTAKALDHSAKATTAAKAAAEQLSAQAGQIKQLTEDLTALKAKLDNTPAHQQQQNHSSQRPPATGGTGNALTDC